MKGVVVLGFGLITLLLILGPAALVFFFLWKKEDELGMAVTIGIVVLFAMFFFSAFIVSPASNYETRLVDGGYWPLVALNSGGNQKLSGSFVLGSGSVNGSTVISYKYLTTVNSDLEMRQLSVDQAENIYIREDSSTNPRLEVYNPEHRFVKKPGLPDWLWAGLGHPMLNRDWAPDTDENVKPTYRFFVPAGSVKYGYDINTQ